MNKLLLISIIIISVLISLTSCAEKRNSKENIRKETIDNLWGILAKNDLDYLASHYISFSSNPWLLSPKNTGYEIYDDGPGAFPG